MTTAASWVRGSTHSCSVNVISALPRVNPAPNRAAMEVSLFPIERESNEARDPRSLRIHVVVVYLPSRSRALSHVLGRWGGPARDLLPNTSVPFS